MAATVAVGAAALLGALLATTLEVVPEVVGTAVAVAAGAQALKPMAAIIKTLNTVNKRFCNMKVLLQISVEIVG